MRAACRIDTQSQLGCLAKHSAERFGNSPCKGLAARATDCIEHEIGHPACLSTESHSHGAKALSMAHSLLLPSLQSRARALSASERAHRDTPPLLPPAFCFLFFVSLSLSLSQKQKTKNKKLREVREGVFRPRQEGPRRGRVTGCPLYGVEQTPAVAR